jgi:hypothetical protein
MLITKPAVSAIGEGPTFTYLFLESVRHAATKYRSGTCGERTWSDNADIAPLPPFARTLAVDKLVRAQPDGGYMPQAGASMIALDSAVNAH